MTARDTAWLKERLAWHDTAIAEYETAALALGSGAQSYRINTGQTEQTVTRPQLAQLRVTLEGLYQQRANLYAQLYGGSTYARPGW